MFRRGKLGTIGAGDIHLHGSGVLDYVIKCLERSGMIRQKRKREEILCNADKG